MDHDRAAASGGISVFVSTTIRHIEWGYKELNPTRIPTYIMIGLKSHPQNLPAIFFLADSAVHPLNRTRLVLLFTVHQPICPSFILSVHCLQAPSTTVPS